MEATAPCLDTEKNKASPGEASTSTKQKNRWAYFLVKRAFDFFFALMGLVVLTIPMMILALVIVLDSPGAPVFRQKRMGKDGKIFTIYKLRTMYTYAPREVATNSLDTGTYTTKVGHFLRLCSLDELPQLWNVLIGNMSFVGYRPVCLSETYLNQLRKEYGVFAAKPGITGYAQVNGRDNVAPDEKAEMDRYYVENCSVRLDLWCIGKTVRVAVTKEGAK